MYRSAAVNTEELRPYLHGYILALTSSPGLSQEQIARRQCVDKSSVARALSVLEKMGYVERKRSEQDRRITLVYPTSLAIEAGEKIRGLYRSWNEYLGGAFSAEEAEQFAFLLEKAAKRAAEYAKEKIDSEAEEGFEE